MALNNFPTVNKENEKVHILSQDEHKIFGVYWDKSASPTMVRTDDSEGLQPVIGVDGQYVKNPFDDLPIYRDIIEVRDSLGNSFIQIPKFYIQEKMGKGFYQLRISKTKHPGFYLPKVFWDHVNQKELPYYWHGKCKGTVENNILKSSKGTVPTIGHSINYVRSAAIANNTNGLKGYQLLDIHAVNVLQALFIVEHATLRSQTVMSGYVLGLDSIQAASVTVAETAANRIIVTNGNAAKFAIGQSLNFKGSYIGEVISIEALDDTVNSAVNFVGTPQTTVVGDFLWNFPWKNGFSADILPSNGSLVSNTDAKHPCVYRGIESPWGDAFQFVDGIISKSREYYVSENPDEYSDHTKYVSVGYSGPTGGGNIQEMGFNMEYPYAKLPITLGGTDGNYYTDRFNMGLGTRVAAIGGFWAGGSNAGIFSWDFAGTPTGTGFLVGGRLIKKAIGE